VVATRSEEFDLAAERRCWADVIWKDATFRQRIAGLPFGTTLSDLRGWITLMTRYDVSRL